MDLWARSAVLGLVFVNPLNFSAVGRRLRPPAAIAALHALPDFVVPSQKNLLERVPRGEIRSPRAGRPPAEQQDRRGFARCRVRRTCFTSISARKASASTAMPSLPLAPSAALSSEPCHALRFHLGRECVPQGRSAPTRM